MVEHKASGGREYGVIWIDNGMFLFSKPLHFSDVRP